MAASSGGPGTARREDRGVRRRPCGSAIIAGGTVVTDDDNVVQTGGKYQIQIGQAGKVWIGDRDERSRLPAGLAATSMISKK